MREAVNKFTLNSTFLSQIFFALENVEDNSIKTAGTTGLKRYFNKDYFQKFDVSHQVSILAHETLHDVLEHWSDDYRSSMPIPIVRNAAMDYVINRLLKEEKINGTNNGYPLDSSWLYDPKYDGMTEKEIYDDLMKNNVKIEQIKIQFKSENSLGEDVLEGEGSGEGEGDEGKGKVLTAEERQQAKEKIKNAVAEAYTLSKQIGSISAGLERIVKDILYPKRKWYDILREYFHTMAWHDYDWSKINQREIVKTGFITPKLYSETLGNVLIAIDCSGSIGESELSEFEQRINEILEECKPENTHLVYFDTKVLREVDVKPDEFPIKLKPIGGGGTDFRWLKDYNDQEVDVCVFLTDGHGCYPEQGEVTYPVIWCLNHDGEMSIPFGEVLRTRSN